MVDRQEVSSPIGWWLKEANARLDAAFEIALADTGVDRRGWQVLATLGRGQSTRADLSSALLSFDPPAVVALVIDGLVSAGCIEESAEGIALTTKGADRLVTLVPVVEGVRRQVTDALSAEEYIALIALLAQLIERLPQAE